MKCSLSNSCEIIQFQPLDSSADQLTGLIIGVSGKVKGAEEEKKREKKGESYSCENKQKLGKI